MLQHTSAPVVQAAPAVGPLEVVDIASICESPGHLPHLAGEHDPP